MNFEIQEHDIMKKRPIVPLFFILILVLVEDGLWQQVRITITPATGGLNPCFNGRWSLTHGKALAEAFNEVSVLILVLMEDGLWQQFLQLIVYQHAKEIDFTNFNWFLKCLLKIFSPVNICVAKL